MNLSLVTKLSWKIRGLEKQLKRADCNYRDLSKYVKHLEKERKQLMAENKRMRDKLCQTYVALGRIIEKYERIANAKKDRRDEAQPLQGG